MNATPNVQRKSKPEFLGKRDKPSVSGAAPIVALRPMTPSSCACGGSCPRCNKKLPLQTKLAVSEPGDALEREADRVADQVLSMSPARVSAESGIRPRSTMQLSRASSSASAPTRAAPSAVHDTLRSTGQPLDTATRGFFEPRFGRDLSDVRIHTGPQPAASARAMNALAYTVGHNVVFDAGQYAPHSSVGRRLLAHELTHVVQQSYGAAPMLQRKEGKCPPFPPPGFTGVVTHSHIGSPGGDVLSDSFSVMSDSKDPLDFSFRSTAGPDPSVTPPAEFFGGLRWEMSGDGSFIADPQNGTGRWLRPNKKGSAVFTLRTIAQDCLMARKTIGVIEPIIIDNRSKQKKKEDEPKKQTGPICGPNISTQLADVLTDVRTTFAGWSNGDRRKACLEIITIPSAFTAWDIHELYLPETGWLRSPPYTPSCGKPGPMDESQGIEDKTLCSNSVEVDGKCFLAGTVNYALFGQMFRLCADAGQPLDMMHPMPLDRSIMKRMITHYKGYGYIDDDGPPSAWAEAGFDGYPGNVPSGSNENRAHCVGRCPVTYQGDPFTWVWEPNHGEGR